MLIPKLFFLPFALLIFPLDASSSSIKLINGTVEFLRNEKAIKVRFTYLTEITYGEVNSSTSKQEMLYKSEMDNIYAYAKDNLLMEKSFTNLFEKNSKLAIDNGPYANYLFIVNVDHVVPGILWEFGRYNAECDLTVRIIEIKTEKEIAIVSLKNMKGRLKSFTFGYGQSNSSMLEEAFAKAGKELAKFLEDKF